MSEDKKPSLWNEIKRIGDELEVKMNLASKDARDRWEALKPRLKALEEKVHTKLDEKTAQASARVAEELDNVGALIRELRDDVAARAK